MLRRVLLAAAALSAAGCGSESGNRPPIARAGDDVQAYVGDDVTLDGSASEDADGDSLELLWTVIQAPPASAAVAGTVLSGTGTQATLPADVAGNFVIALDVSDGSAGHRDVVAVTVIDPLRVVATSPQAGGSAFDQAPVVAIFSRAIRPWTADGVGVEDLSDPVNPVAVVGSVSVEDGDTSLTFFPANPWTPDAPYRLTIAAAVLALDGASVRDPVVVDFTGAAADTTAPRVLAVTPAAGSLGAPHSSFVDVLFSEPVDAATLSGATFTLTPSGSSALPASVTLSAGGVRALLVMTSGTLAADTDHTIAVDAAVLDANGNALDGNGDGTAGDAFASSFRTAIAADSTAPRVLSVSPFLGAQGVSVKLPIRITFDERIDRTTIDGTTLVVTTGGADAISGTFSFELGDTVAVFTPAANLLTATRYDIRVASTITDVAQNPLGAETTSYYRTGAAPPPTVLSVSPPTVAVSSTVTVDIAGEDFMDGATVAVLGGGVLVGTTTWIDPQLIQAELTLAPTAALGDRTLRVINPDGESGNGLNLLSVTPKAPLITSLNPVSMQRGTTSDVVITGTDFRNTPADPTVSFSGAGITVNTVTYDSSTQLTANITIAPGAAAGDRSVTVTNPGGLFDTEVDGFLVMLPAPNITSLGTTSARRRASITVVINGTNFFAPATVSFGGGIGVSNVTVVSPTRIDADVSVGAMALLGSRDVTVTNPDGQLDTQAAAFTVLRALPVVTNVNPSSGSRQGGTMTGVTFTGTDFDCSVPMTVPAISLGAGITVASISCGGSTSNTETTLTASLTLTAAAALGLKNVTVTNPADSAQASLNLFTVNAEAPTLTSVSPNPQQGETRIVNVTGNFFQTTPTVSVGGGITVGSVTRISATQLDVEVTVPFTTAIPGPYSVTVTNPDLQQVMGNVLTVVTAPPPIVIGPLSPDFGEQGANGYDVAISGQNFQPGAGTTTVAFSGGNITVTAVNVLSPTSILATINIGGGAATTARNVTVTNPVGTVNADTLNSAFTVTGPAPTITTVNPTSGAQNTNIPAFQINGTNFRAGATSVVGAIPCSAPTVTATQITCALAIPAGEPTGFKNVVVTNTDGSQATLINGFQVTASGGGPTVSALNTSALTQGKTTRVQIVGANFVSGATVSVSGGVADVTESAATFFSSTRLQVDLTVACGSMPLGPRDLIVTNPDGRTGTLANGVTIRNGVVINEVITQNQSAEDEVEIYNDSNCTIAPLNGWRLQLTDSDGFYDYIIGSLGGAVTGEVYSAGNGTSFAPGRWMTIQKVDNSKVQNDVYLLLLTDNFELVDEVEIGHDPEGDGSTDDGAPASGNDGGNGGANDESVGRCPNGRDTENDINDFYQNETGGVEMARTLAGSNNAQCPQCSDGADNDTNGWFDWPLDSGCSGPTDNTESGGSTSTQCNDNVNNDGQAGTDETDPDCFSAADNSEGS